MITMSVSATMQFWEEFKLVTRSYVKTNEVNCTLPTFYFNIYPFYSLIGCHFKEFFD